MPKAPVLTNSDTAAKKSGFLSQGLPFSKNKLIIFAFLFGLAGGYILWRTFAAEPLIASQQSEQMSLPRWGSVKDVSSASNGKIAELLSNGTASGTVTLPSSATSLKVLAKGSKCNNDWPVMTVSLDGKQIINTRVSSTSWKEYSGSVSAAKGTHTLSIKFSNDYWRKYYCDRNLYLDVTNFYGPTVETPKPTITFSASPTTVTVGNSSTLTWSSANTTGCIASGAWSGNKTSSGSVSTGALNSSSTYNLSCTGPGGAANATAGVTVSAQTPPPPVTPPSSTPSSGLYGVPWYASSLGNIEIGKNGGQTYSYGFNSLYSGDTANLQFFLIFRAAGYYAGNGGQIKVELSADSGGKPGTAMASYLITNPMSENWPKVPLKASLTAGKRYWIKFSNPAPDPSNNWVSVDDLYASNNIPPGSADMNLVALQNSSQNTNHIPVFTLTMADGKTQGGPGYIDCPSRYDGGNGASVVFTPKTDRKISAVYARVSGSGTITAELGGKSGSASASTGWVTIPLSLDLKKGTSYTLVLKGSFTIEALQKGTPQGFADPFPDGHAVVSGRSDIDYPVYFK